jgi:hypothetical protein
MAFEKLRTIVITVIPKPRSYDRFRKIAETIPTPRKRASRSVLRMAFRADHFAPLIREIFHVVDDEHFMFPTGAREAGRPAEPSAASG